MKFVKFGYQNTFLGVFSILLTFLGHGQKLICAAEKKSKIHIRTDPRTRPKKLASNGVSLWLQNNPQAYFLNNPALKYYDRTTIEECIWYGVLKPHLISVTRDLEEPEIYHVELFSPGTPGLLLSSFRAPDVNPIQDIQFTQTRLGDGIEIRFINRFFIVNLPIERTLSVDF